MNTPRIIELIKEARQFRGNHPHPIAEFDRATAAAMDTVNWIERYGKQLDQEPNATASLMFNIRRMIAAIPAYQKWATAPWYQPRVSEIAAELLELLKPEGADTVSTYTIQSHNPSGETYALRYNDKNVITGVFGPMHYADVERITAAEERSDCQLIAELEYQTEDNEWANASQWQHPTWSSDQTPAPANEPTYQLEYRDAAGAVIATRPNLTRAEADTAQQYDLLCLELNPHLLHSGTASITIVETPKAAGA